MKPTLEYVAPGIAYETVRGKFAGVRPACPRCPWRGDRVIAAGTYKWRSWLELDVKQHPCSNPVRTDTDQEKPS